MKKIKSKQKHIICRMFFIYVYVHKWMIGFLPSFFGGIPVVIAIKHIKSKSKPAGNINQKTTYGWDERFFKLGSSDRYTDFLLKQKKIKSLSSEKVYTFFNNT